MAGLTATLMPTVRFGSDAGTDEPSSTIVPLISWPSVTGSSTPVYGFFVPGGGEKRGPPRYSWMSEPQMPQ
jgi:hypothetical protein